MSNDEHAVVDVLWAPLRDKKISKKDFATCAAQLNDLLAPAGDRRSLVLAHVPRHLFEDVQGKVDPDVAFDMVVRCAKTHGWAEVEHCVRGTLSVDALSPFQPEVRAEAREAVRSIARTALEEAKNEDPQVGRQLFATTPGTNVMNQPSLTQPPPSQPTSPVITEAPAPPSVTFAATPPQPQTQPPQPLTIENVSRIEGRSRRHRRHHDDSSDSSATTVSSDAGFENPRVLLEPRRWRRVAERDGIEDLRRQLRNQLGVEKLAVTQPGKWTTQIAEDLSATLPLLLEGSTVLAAEKLLEVLWRFKGLSDGASPQAIEESVRVLKGAKLPKQFQDAAKKLKSAPAKTVPTTKSGNGSFRDKGQGQQQTQHKKPAKTE
jgi:hypothetical protein